LSIVDWVRLFVEHQTLGVGRSAFDFRRSMFCFLGSPYNRPHWDLHDFWQRRTPVHLLSHPVRAALRFDDWFVEKIREIIHMPIRAQNHIAAASAIAAIRPAFRHKFLPPKTHAPAATVPRLCKNFNAINEHCAFRLPSAATHVIPTEARNLPLKPQITCSKNLSQVL
jgi:hypothetical protein